MDLLRNRTLSRRSLLAGAGGIGAVALGARMTEAATSRPAVAPGYASTGPKKVVRLVGTDGWASMPRSAPADPPFFPDPLAPQPYNTYVFGFRDATGLTDAQLGALRGKAQISAPMMYFDEGDEITITLTNLGLATRPDLFDGHTLHWHGFVNAIPLFDGVPELSLSVPVGRDFDYFYKVRDAGTYMYHCHFEDVEHVQMGMTGMVFVRPAQNRGVLADPDAGVPHDIPVGKYAYNDKDGSTRYDREYAYIMTELWSAAHYRDAHIQVSDWTDFDPAFHLLNGRAYPQTLAPNTNPRDPATGTRELDYQPISTLVRCNEGERVLLRLSNLGYEDHSMTCDNIDLTVVAKDASLLMGRDGTRNYQTTSTVTVGGGESRDVLFTAPKPGSYFLYDRDFSYQSNGGGAGYGGMMTRIDVSPAGTLPAQTAPNDCSVDGVPVFNPSIVA